MKQYILLLGLFVSLTYAQEAAVTIAFEEKEYCAVEGGSFEFCIAALSGAASNDFNVTVERSYLRGSATGTNVIEVSAGYDFESDPLCVTEVTVNNECLDSGNEIILSIDSDSLPAEVAVADGCGEARVEVFDDEVIRYSFSMNVFYADEGDSEVQVCVNATWVTGPTKRAVPLLFSTVRQDSVVDLQKKIVLIPKDTEEGDMICCPIAISEDLDVADDDVVEFLVTVNSEDVNVVGPQNPSVTVRVHSVVEEVCDPIFENDTPMVTGRIVTVDLMDCVEEALCQVTGGPMVDCANGPINLSLRGTNRRTVTVRVTSPVEQNFTRVVRPDNDNCDVHIINEGITADGTSGVVMFEGTAPAATIPQSTFQCSVSDLSGTILLDQMNLECTSPWSFSLPDSTSSFQVSVRPDQIAGCRRALGRTFQFIRE